jgi:hypothetical protein
VHIFAQNKYTMKDLAEFLTMRIGALENELRLYQERQQHTKEGLSEAIQLLIDLTDPNCPREYEDVVKDEIKRLSKEHFLRNH